jgi:hypothetical protein
MKKSTGRDYPLSTTPNLSSISQGPGSPMVYNNKMSSVGPSMTSSSSSSSSKSSKPRRSEANSVSIIKAGADVVRAAREGRAANINAKANKVEAVADRKQASSEKITARKQGRAEIIRARADLARAKRGQ